MNPKQFLTIGGGILALVGILGFAGIIGPTPDQSLFGSTWWFDNGENWAHLIIGLIGIAMAFALSVPIQRMLVMILGVVGILIGLYSLFIGTNFYGSNLENPADTILHLAFGVWALLVYWRK